MNANRRVVLPLAACVLALGVGVAVAVEHGQGGAPKTALTAHESAVALATATHEAARVGKRVDLATVSVGVGGDASSNTGVSCGSGRVLEISLYGTFSVTTGGRLGGGAQAPVTEMDYVADPVTGHPCLVSAVTGQASPDPDATVLFGSDASRSP